MIEKKEFSFVNAYGSYEGEVVGNEDILEIGQPNRQKSQKTYINPVFEPVLADPSLIRCGGYFYAYGTEEDWGDEGGHKLVHIIKSSDLVNWESIGDAFQKKPCWKTKGLIWSPNVVERLGRFYMYYSFSTWGDANPGIGLAIAEKPEGPFLDQGKLFLSKEVGVLNSIDPHFIEEQGRPYLFWGSFHGIYVSELNYKGTQLVSEKIKIGHRHLEASKIIKHDGSFYYFGSMGSCCKGAKSTYRIIVGKSDNLLGPYNDKKGNNIAEGCYGEVLLAGNPGKKGFAGPGQNTRVIIDDTGSYWLLYHAIQKSNPKLQNGASRRALMLDRVRWKDGWPEVAGSTPSITVQIAPSFH